MEKIITCTSPVNIAVIKYWGKRDEDLILPLNDSVSFTLSQNEMCTTTTIIMSPKFKSDRLWLNQKEENINNPRILNCLKEVRRLGSKRKVCGEDCPYLNWHVHICSQNNFPTAAGLASSAAGYACLVFCLGKLFKLEGNLSGIARLGSGSACRSVSGGLVHWRKGKAFDGADSIAEQIAPNDHWSDLRVIICVANSGQKKTSSSEGMRRSVQTSFLLKCRTRESVIRRIDQLFDAVTEKDWSSFCDLTMADSNEMHAVCLDTSPPCVYMNDTSHAVADLVHNYNKVKSDSNKTDEKICYTFDAGPNACIFVPGKVVDEVSSILEFCFPASKSTNSPVTFYWRGIPVKSDSSSTETFKSLIDRCAPSCHSMKYFLHTQVGDGPQVLSDQAQDSVHLIDQISGLPKTIVVQEGSQISKA